MADDTGPELQIGDAPHIDENCGVTEEQFPMMRKCCIRSSDGSWQKYQKLCPHCAAWTSLPDGRGLEVATIFECKQCGYAKRVKE